MSYQLLVIVAAKNGSSVAVYPTGTFSSAAVAEAEKVALTKRLEAPLPPGETGTAWEYRIEVMRKT